MMIVVVMMVWWEVMMKVVRFVVSCPLHVGQPPLQL